MLRWTREEEFTWAYFRPAGVIEMEASLDAANRIATWRHINISSGGNSINTPYNVGKKNERNVRSQPPLREGSYRALGVDGQFVRPRGVHGRAGHARGRRSARIPPGPSGRTAAAAGARSGGGKVSGGASAWPRSSRTAASAWRAAGTRARSSPAAWRSKSIPTAGDIRVVEVCEAFECGKVINPDNLRSQIEGAIVMGLGPALSEAMQFDDKRITNASFPPLPRATFPRHAEDRNACSSTAPISRASAPAKRRSSSSPRRSPTRCFTRRAKRVRQMPMRLEA